MDVALLLFIILNYSSLLYEYTSILIHSTIDGIYSIIFAIKWNGAV